MENKILHYDKAGNKVIDKAENNRWDTQRTKTRYGQKKKNYIDRILFLIKF